MNRHVRRLWDSLNYRARSYVARRRDARRWSREPGSEPGRLRVLVVESRVPHPHLGAGYPRSNLIVHQLVRLGYDVTVYPLLRSVEGRRSAYRDLPAETEIILNYGLPRFASFLERRGTRYACVFVTRPHNMAAVAGILDGWGQGRVIYDAEALGTLRDFRLRALRGQPAEPGELDAALRAELSPARLSRCISTVSAEERRHVERIMPQPVRELGYAYEARPTPEPFAARDGFLLVGVLVDATDSPNTDGLTWFLDEVLPRIRARLGPGVRVDVAGPCPEGLRRRLARPGVTFHGTVRDLAATYDAARVFIAATRFSAGLPLKVYEAAAHGVPVVATSLIAGQVGWTAGSDLAVADTADDFAAACIRLHTDPAAWQGIRDNALARIRADCSLERFGDQLRQVIATAVGEPDPSSR